MYENQIECLLHQLKYKNVIIVVLLLRARIWITNLLVKSELYNLKCVEIWLIKDQRLFMSVYFSSTKVGCSSLVVLNFFIYDNE